MRRRRRHFILCITGILCVACAPAAASSLLPIPDPAAQYKARDLVRETFQRDFAAQGINDRRALARKLLDHAVETDGDPAARYVLLCDARDIAASAGDVAVTCRSIGLLGRHYDVQELTLTASALTTASGLTLPAAGNAALARAALSAVARAVAKDDYDTAFRLMTLATSAANKSRDPELNRLVAERARELRALKTDFESLRAATDKLKEDADDAAANALVGRYRCLTKADFVTSLPYLCKSSDAPLRLVAARAASTEQPDAFEIANLWWDLAEAYTGLARRNLRTHAATLYRTALPKLTGLHRAAAETRLRAADEEAMRDLNLTPGLVAELFKTVAFADPVATRIDRAIDFEWEDKTGSPDVHPGLRDDFSVRWTGVLRTTAPGKYTFTTLANTGARIYLNDKLVLDAPNLTRNRNGTRFTLDLPPGLHPLKVEFWDTTGLARIKLLWQPPGSAKEEVVPAEHLYHDALVY